MRPPWWRCTLTCTSHVCMDCDDTVNRFVTLICFLVCVCCQIFCATPRRTLLSMPLMPLALSHPDDSVNVPLRRFNEEVKHIKVIEKDSWIHITEAKKFESLLVRSFRSSWEAGSSCEIGRAHV